MPDSNRFKLAQEFVFWLAVVVLALIVGFYVPMLGLATAGVLAAPLVLFTINYGTGMGVSLLLTIAVLLGLIFGNTAGIGFLCEFGVLSQALVFGFRRKFSQEKIILTGFVLTALAVMLLVAGTTLFSREGSLSSQIKQQIEESIAETLQTYETMEVDPEQKRVFQQAAVTVKDFMLKAYTGVYASITLLIVIANCFASKLLLTRMGYDLGDLSPFIKLVLPEPLVWGFIISASFVVLTSLSLVNSALIQLLGLNLTLIFTTFYLVQGLAILVFWGGRSRLPRPLKWLGLFLLIVQPFFLLLIAVVGLFDTWFDLRKLKQQPV